MPSRGLRGLWLRSVAGVAACLLALSSTGALVAAAVTAPGSAPSVVLVDHGNGGGGGTTSHDGEHSGGDGIAHGHPTPVAATPTAEPATNKAKPKPKPTPKPAETHNAVPHADAKTVTPHHTTSAAAPPAAAPTARVVVDSSDPAPFSAQAVSAAEAARVLPVESLGPLSGISFGSGLFIWPLLLAVDVLALAVIARLALRRRLASPED